jgi:2-amino-4-hydroxy-6-hydroxymethyldihydropteridine diphosphokinase
LKVIETGMGRTGGHQQSREIDLDLVSYGEELVASEALVLPHPRFHERHFVLVPLREIAPGFVCPRTGRGVDDMLARLPGDGGVARVSGRTRVAQG